MNDPPEPNAAEQIFVFGDHRLVPRRQLLLRNNRPVRVGSRAFDLLRMLVERHGEVVSKEQLISRVWPDTFVHESNLKVNIAALRRALAGPGSSLHHIATVPGRGYRFVAPVQRETSARLATLALVSGEPPGNLPPAPHLIGREAELLDLEALMAPGRLLTLVGPAGVGKTSLATALARAAAEAFDDGTCFVDLAAVGDARLVCPAIATALAAGGSFQDTLAGVVEALRGRRALLILDNCEHVVGAAAMVVDHLCAALPDLTLVATSREPLRSRFERVHGVSPLSFPADSAALDRGGALSFPAVALFSARASEAAGFELSEADIGPIVEICRRLDGIPLALELAAWRLTTSTPSALLAELDRSFQLLAGEPRASTARHQTLTATLDWSYRLLSDQEAFALRLLAVFAGDFSLEDAVGLGVRVGLAADEVTRCVTTLAAKSLLSSRFADGRLRYRMLEATRAYAVDRQEAAGETFRALAAHAQLTRDLFETAEVEWRWRAAEDWSARYGDRINDLRKALDWSLEQDADTALRLTAAAIPLWDALSLVGESRQRVERALGLARAAGGVDRVLLMKLTLAHAWAFTFSDHLGKDGEHAWLEGLALAQGCGDVDYELRALWGLAVWFSFTGRHRLALDRLEAFEALAPRETDRSAGPDGERLRAMTAFYCGDILGAHGDLQALARDHAVVNHRARIARFQLDRFVAIRVSLAMAAWTRGRVAEAKAAASAALAGALAIRHDVSQANALALAALPLAVLEGDIDQAETHLAALFDNLTRRDIGIWRSVGGFFSGAIAHARGDLAAAPRMAAALAAVEASNFRVRLPLYATLLAEAALETDRLELARSAIDKALGAIEAQDELWCLPEALRVRGLIESRGGAAADAEATLRLAIEKADLMAADMFTLRSAIALADLWTRTGRLGEALGLLGEMVERFDDGLGGRDLGRARQRLERLRGGPASATPPA